MMKITRRGFLRSASVFAIASGIGVGEAMAQDAKPAPELDFPLADMHVHLDNSSVEQVLTLPAASGVKFGIVEHAGVKENQYPTVLSNDEELLAYIKMLDGKPVFKGVQAEYIDWKPCFSDAVLDKLDFVLTDAMTMTGKDGRRMKLWEKGIDLGEPNAFMDRYVDWHSAILSSGRVDILANVSWLPEPFAADYDALWTEARMRKVVDAAVKQKVAVEISSSFKLPKTPFLKMAKDAGLKFTFGSNGRYPKMGILDYSAVMAKELGLKRSDLFEPPAKDAKA
jgi:histidinol phosphatase-like PHP family hydrolase